MVDEIYHKSVDIIIDHLVLKGEFNMPDEPKGLVIFAHGAGSSRFSPRNQFVAGLLNDNAIGTLLFDLLTEEEDRDFDNRFNIDLLTDRLVKATDWIQNWSEDQKVLANLPLGFFGASTGAAAAIRAAIILENKIAAIVSRGGRIDLVGAELSELKSPILAIVGSNDQEVLELNKKALELIDTEKKIIIIPGAEHLFDNPGELEKVARLAINWFNDHLCR